MTNPPDSADGVPGVNEIDKAGLVIAVLAQTSFSDLDRVWFLDATGSYDDEARATLSAHVESDVKFVADAEDAWGDAGRLPEGEILLGFTDPVRLDSASR